MMKASNGFTLIELVVVIVILGILSATALPKFIDLSGDAKVAALDGVTGAIASASAINYGGRSANSSKGVATQGATCAAAIGATGTSTGILSGGIPTGYVVSGPGGGTLVAGSNDCTITQSNGGATGTAIVIGVP